MIFQNANTLLIKPLASLSSLLLNTGTISCRIFLPRSPFGNLLGSSCDGMLLPLSTGGFNLKLPAVFEAIERSYSKNFANELRLRAS